MVRFALLLTMVSVFATGGCADRTEKLEGQETVEDFLQQQLGESWNESAEHRRVEIEQHLRVGMTVNEVAGLIVDSKTRMLMVGPLEDGTSKWTLFLKDCDLVINADPTNKVVSWSTEPIDK